MENKVLFNYLMDMWAAHYNSYDELYAVYDAVNDFANGIVIHDKKVYVSKESEDARKSVFEWSYAAQDKFVEMFAACLGFTLKKEGSVTVEAPADEIDSNIIMKIIETYAVHLRENSIFTDTEYKETIWKQLQTDPTVYR